MKFPCVYNNVFPVSKVSLQIEDVGSPSKEYPTKYHYSSPHVSKYQTSFVWQVLCLDPSIGASDSSQNLDNTIYDCEKQKHCCRPKMQPEL